MNQSDNPVEQPRLPLLTGFTHCDYKEREHTPKYLKDYLYCHKQLGEGLLPRCPLLEEVFNYSKCSTSVSDIFLPPDLPAPKRTKKHTEVKLDSIGRLISYLNFWINEKVEPENKIFWFYAYSTSPCKRRFAVIENLLGDLITEFNFNNPAIANEIKELTKELRDKAKEWDDYNDLAKQTEQWIAPHHSRYSLFEVKEAAAALLYKLHHVGSMVREEQKPSGKAGQGKTEKPGLEALELFKVPISKLIKCGEGHTIEFKETLEWDVKQNQHNQNLNKECLKTIAAFLNTDGGTLLIGVRDNGEVIGIERDLQNVQRKNRDGFELKLRNLMRSRFAPRPLRKVKVTFKRVAKRTVCRIDVSPVSLSQVVHLDNEVYVRDGNTTLKLDGRDLTHWIQQRGQAAGKSRTGQENNKG